MAANIPIVVDYTVGNQRAIIRLQKGYYNPSKAQTLFARLKEYDASGLTDEGIFRGNEWTSERKTIQISDPGVSRYRYPGSNAKHTEPFDKYPTIEQLRQDLLTRTNYQLNFMLYNSYTKNASLGWHSDKESNMVTQSPIISWSFGFPRRFRVRTKDDKHTILFDGWLESGDLLIMEQDCQELTEHCIWKLTKTELKHFGSVSDDQMFRINVTGRTMYVKN